jgi:glycosyltransferase involved in cell wall biosynthesis
VAPASLISAAIGAVPGVVADRTLPTPITVSVTCPTFNRQGRHESLYRSFHQQTYPHRDLWVLDDSPAPSPFFTRLQDEHVHYVHMPGPHLSTGAKRNWLIAHSSGSVIVHFDDDDWYGPGYVQAMLDRLVRADADFITLAIWNERRERDGRRWTRRPKMHSHIWGYGFSYVYRRHVATRVHFPDVTMSEDYAFLHALRHVGLRPALVHDGAGWVERLLHGHNTSARHV